MPGQALSELSTPSKARKAGTIRVNTSDDGMIYSYLVDVEPYAKGDLRADLLARFGTLEIEVSRNFLDDIHPDM